MTEAVLFLDDGLHENDNDLNDDYDDDADWLSVLYVPI